MRRKERERLQRIHFREITGRTKSPGCSSPRSCPKRILSWTVGRHLCSLVPLPTTAGLGGAPLLRPALGPGPPRVSAQSEPELRVSVPRLARAPQALRPERGTTHLPHPTLLGVQPHPHGRRTRGTSPSCQVLGCLDGVSPPPFCLGGGGEFLRGETTIRLRPEAKSFRQRYIARRWTFS